MDEEARQIYFKIYIDKMTRDIFPDKKTISKMWPLEQWKYIEEQKKLGNVIEYKTEIKSAALFSNSNIIIYYDKNTDVYTECHPSTGSLYVDITKEEFDKLIESGSIY